MRNSRATVVGIVVGILALAVVVGYSVGLPKAVGGDDGQSSPSLPTLPDRLDASFVAMSAVTPGDFSFTASQNKAVAKGVGRASAQQDANASKKLSDLYGTPAVVRYYARPKDVLTALRTGQAIESVAVTVIATPPGLVLPSGPVTADGATLGHYDLTKVHGHQCATVFQGAQPKTPVSPATPASYKLSECRGTSGGLTYDVFGTGVSLDQVAGYLDDLLAHANQG